MFEWDEKKSQQNKAVRGFDFSIVEQFDFDTALTILDNRKDYGEIRFRSTGRIEGKLFSVTWTARGKNIRIISVRRAHKKECRGS
ncbi:BrnT family toxin [Sneathiella marina]|uniref:BrnT family toxin n=1 Tax=Sneathiella marina TaxID=2950108 RepID=UPI003B847550